VAARASFPANLQRDVLSFLFSAVFFYHGFKQVPRSIIYC
jgi:hypothetical protein